MLVYKLLLFFLRPTRVSYLFGGMCVSGGNCRNANVGNPPRTRAYPTDTRCHSKENRERNATERKAEENLSGEFVISSPKRGGVTDRERERERGSKSSRSFPTAQPCTYLTNAESATHIVSLGLCCWLPCRLWCLGCGAGGERVTQHSTCKIPPAGASSCHAMPFAIYHICHTV